MLSWEDFERCRTIDGLIRLRRKAVNDKNFVIMAASKIIETPSIAEEVINNPEKLIECCFSVVNKDKETVPFRFNEVQREFIRQLNQAKVDHAKGKLPKISIIILKSRQQGFTTLITAYQLALILLNKNFSGFTVADTRDNSEVIFRDKAKYTYNELPPNMHPHEQYNSRKELQFDVLNSSWSVAVASDDLARSRTLNFFHGSECAFWKNIGVIQSALTPSMTSDCISIYETTANGFNEFKVMWDKHPGVNLFFPWWLTSEYSTPVKTAEQRETLSKAEQGEDWIGKRLRWLKSKSISMAKRHWYYQQFLTYIDPAKIRQEYPCTAEEAFITSGRPVFDTEKLTQRLADLPEPIQQITFMPTWKTPEDRDRIEGYRIFKGSNIKIYEKVKPNIPYVIGGDTAGDGSDAYTASVRRNDTGKQVATLHMAIGSDSSPYTDQLYCLGMYYNRALIGIEVNFNLQPVIELQRLRYPRQYVRTIFDGYNKPTQEKYGWKTDGNTRPILYTLYAQMINEDVNSICDKQTLIEAREWEYDDKSRPNHRSGGHDDCLFADMIANKIREQQSYEIASTDVRVIVAKDVYEDYVKADKATKAMIIKRYGGIPKLRDL